MAVADSCQAFCSSLACGLQDVVGLKQGSLAKAALGCFTHGSKPCVTSGKSLLIPVPHWRNSPIPMVETTTAKNEPQLMIPRSSEASWMSQLGTPRLWGQ